MVVRAAAAVGANMMMVCEMNETEEGPLCIKKIAFGLRR